MARKTVCVKPAKRKKAVRKAEPPPGALPLCAHPRLIHGFLIRLAMVRIRAAENERPALTVAARILPQLTFPADVRHEGPADDAIFH
jgi:hypothetical protein